MVETEKKLLWIWLKNIFVSSDLTVWKLHKAFGGIEKIYGASRADYRAAGLKEDKIEKLSDKSLYEAEQILKKTQKLGIKVVCTDDEDYPFMLSHIYDPPPVLYVAGDLNRIKGKLTVAGVGTRHANDYGINIAKKISASLAGAGAVVVSGMALGIDTAVHTGALSEDGVTVAVLGTAIDRIYPAENAQLYRKIAETGAVISEHPPGYRGFRSDFARRNRIIVGLCHGVFVCQAPDKSGSLITARLALDNGRDLFCVAGNAEPLNEGSNALILEGSAKMIVSAAGIIEEYESRKAEFKIKEAPKAEKEPETEKKADGRSINLSGLSDIGRAIVLLLDERPMSADEICEALGVGYSQVASELTMLELEDCITGEIDKFRIKN